MQKNHLPSKSARIALCLLLLFVTGSAAGQQVTEAPDLDSNRNQQEITAEEARAQKARMRKIQREHRRAQSTEDLQRFAGQYGERNSKYGNRYLYVTVSCDGVLIVGPRWMDLSPWWMKKESETAFSYTDAYTEFSIQFILDEDGKVEELIHDVNGIGSPVVWMEPLPFNWGECIPR